MLLIQEKKQKVAGVNQLLQAVRLRPRKLAYRLAFLDHGIRVVKSPDLLRDVIVEGLEMYPREIMLIVLQAAFIHEWAERTPENWQHVVGMLEGVFRAVPEEATKQRRYITARVHLGDAYAALGRKDEARREYDFVLRLTEANPEQKKLAREGLAALQKCP